MFSLFYGCYEYLTSKEELRFLIVGLDRAGKTTLLERLKSEFAGAPPPDGGKVLPTVGLNIARFQVAGAPLVFWDLGGQPGLRSIWVKYYGDAHGIIYVVDAADPDRLGEAKMTLERVLGKPILLSFC
jgi:ADP-ribosylation factor related protein 1